MSLSYPQTEGGDDVSLTELDSSELHVGDLSEIKPHEIGSYNSANDKKGLHSNENLTTSTTSSPVGEINSAREISDVSRSFSTSTSITSGQKALKQPTIEQVSSSSSYYGNEKKNDNSSTQDVSSAPTIKEEEELPHDASDNETIEDKQESFSDEEEYSLASHSELRDYESFLPDEVANTTTATKAANSQEQLTTASDSSSETKALIEKAVQYPIEETNQSSNTTTATVDDGSSSIGVKKEKSVIDGLKQENFQLKLRIVIIESQLNAASGEGIAELRKQLADAQASKISMQHENSKLRKTIDDLNKNKEREREKVDHEKDKKIRTLEEDVAFYEEERQRWLQEFEMVEQNALNRENEIKQYYEDLLFKEREMNADLNDQCQQMYDELNEAKATAAATTSRANYNNTPKSAAAATTPTDPYHFHDFTSGSSNGGSFGRSSNNPRDGSSSNNNNNNNNSNNNGNTNLSKIYSQVESIKRALSPSAVNNHTPRSRSRMSNNSSSTTLHDPSSLFNYDSTTNPDLFSDLLRQIQDAAYSYSSNYSNLQREYDILNREYENIKLECEKRDGEYEDFLEEIRENHGVELYELQQKLTAKESQLAQSQDEVEDLWQSMDEVKDSLKELEQLRVDYDQVKEELNQSNNRLVSLQLTSNNTQLDLESKKREVQTLTDRKNDLEEKLSGVEAELQATSQKLEDVIKQLEDCKNSIQELEERDADNVFRLSEYSKLRKTVDEVLELMQTSYDEKTDETKLVENLQSAFDLVKEVETNMAQVEDTVSENTKLTNTLEEKETEIKQLEENLGKLQTSSESEASKLNAQISQLQQERDKLKEELEGNKSRIESILEAKYKLEGQIEANDTHYKEQTEQLQNKVAEKDKAINEITESRQKTQNELERYTAAYYKNSVSSSSKSTTTSSAEYDELSSENARLKFEKQEASNKYESIRKMLDQHKREHDLLSTEAKNLQEQLYYESRKSENLEKKVSSLQKQENRRSYSGNVNGQLEASQTFKMETYHRLIELQKKVEDLEKTRITNTSTIKSLENKLQASKDERYRVLRTFFDKVVPILGSNWATRISKEMDGGTGTASSNGSEKSVERESKYKTLERLMVEAVDGLNDMMNKSKVKIKSLEAKQNELYEEMSQYNNNEWSKKVSDLENQVEKLNRQLENSTQELKQAKGQATELENSHKEQQRFGNPNSQDTKDVSVNGEVKKEIFKQISGTFVGKVWLSRYHEMEKRWHNEREARKREYDGYTQHLNECYDRIEGQKKSIRKLKAKIKSMTEESEVLNVTTNTGSK